MLQRVAVCAGLMIRRTFSKTIVEVQDALERHVALLNQSKLKSDSIDSTKMNARTVTESRDRVVIPLASDSSFSLLYTTWRGFLRVGMLMEDLDTFAVWLSYRHNYVKVPTTETEPRPMIFVTACVDRIRLNTEYNQSPKADIVMDGFVSWVGRSSIEISIQCSQETNEGLKQFLSSKFVMVARNMDGTRSMPNTPFKTTNNEEEKLFKEGEAAQIWRKLNEQQSLLKIPPSEDEINILHDLFKKTVVDQGQSSRKRFLPTGHVWMRDATLSDTLLCFPVKRNIYGKIFGGFLMRKAVELAWANSFTFSNSHCQICGLDNIVFRKTVEIGSLVLLNSQVCYTRGCLMQLIVNAEVIHVNGEREVTNTFYFVFQSSCTVPSMMPFSYSEGMLYLDGKRHFEKFQSNSKEYD